jgi:uncharacterized protein (AIM24 family)
VRPVARRALRCAAVRVNIQANPAFAFGTISIDPGGEVLDTGHVVAFDESVRFNVHKAGSWKTSVLGGERLVTRFTGPGRLWLQTRSQDDLVNWLIPRLPSSKNES